MKILIVASYNSKRFSPFVLDQADAIEKLGVEIAFFGIEGKGIKGYYSNRKLLLEKMKIFQPDIIHAHYGLSGLLANLQRKVPVITTYHGCDINIRKVFLFSRIAIFLSKFNIFVAKKLIEIARPEKNYALISCGVDTELFKPLDKAECRAKFGFGSEKLVLFSGNSDRKIKNYALAEAAVKLLPGVQLLELKGYSRLQVSELINACDVMLVTSFIESGPLVIKEAMACNRPVVTTDVGDVRWVIGDTDGCYITSYDVNDCAENIEKAIEFSLKKKETIGRNRIINIGLDSKTVAQKIVEVYHSVLRNKTKNKE